MPKTPDPQLLRMGSSSFSSKDWVGPFYPEGTKPRDFLRLYAERFCTVEVDATYYAVPSTATVTGWAEKTPDDFLLCAKFPRSIVHAGEAAAPDAKKLLTPDATYRDRDAFLRAMSILGPKLGPLLIQFPYFNKKSFETPGPFMERLDQFLEDLPKEFDYAVEIRNKWWLKPDYAALLNGHGVSLTLVDQAWMPHADELEQKLDFNTGPWVYVRLLGDRKQIEAITKSWEKEVIDREERLERWAAFLARTVRQNIPVVVFVNNHFAGHAPATLERLEKMFQSQVAPS